MGFVAAEAPANAPQELLAHVASDVVIDDIARPDVPQRLLVVASRVPPERAPEVAGELASVDLKEVLGPFVRVPLSSILMIGIALM